MHVPDYFEDPHVVGAGTLVADLACSRADRLFRCLHVLLIVKDGNGLATRCRTLSCLIREEACYDDAMESSRDICPSCSQPNLPGSRFCSSCGAPFPPRCPACGAENLVGSRFCNQCGTPFAAASPVTAAPTAAAPPAAATAIPTAAGPIAPAPEEVERPSEERRLVTALFCDLVGFTPLSESLDPEEVRDIQAAYFEAMSAQIERYGGTVEKYAGDAVLALFGAPVAHEDDAERAVLCALGMQAAIEPVAEQARHRWQVEPAIRVGVNTGEVVSGTWNSLGRQDVAVTGDAVNTAARLQAAAEPGEVLVGTETMRLTRRRIRYGERRDLQLKGKAGTVPTYPALGLREQFGERWETEAATPLIGRDREMVELLDVWVRAQAGEGQLVTVIGDVGVGKSRLINELLDKVTASAAIRALRGRCLSYGQEISLWLMADLLRSLFGIRERDTLEEVAARLRVVIPGLLRRVDEETRAEALDVLGEALGLAPGSSMVAHAGAQIRRQALIRSLRLVLGAISAVAPTMLVLEDLHWIDEASQDLLMEILPDVPGLRIMVLAAQRPGWSAPWSEWGWTERLTVRPLQADAAAVLAGAVLGGIRLSPELEQYVAERAGGNPFFVEEMLRALEETGALVEREGQMYLVPGAVERLPSTLTEVLLARLDRLEGQVRSVAQVASVIGRSFAVRLLAQVMERETVALEMPLTALQQAEVAFPKRGSDLEYIFKHVSMREVAYNTLVQKRRQELHVQTARAIAALYSSDEYVEMIAYHYSRTEEHQEAAQWLERAGDRAADVYAVETAIGHYREAMERQRRCAPAKRVSGFAEPLVLARLDEKLGGVLFAAGRYEEALEVLAAVVEIYRQARDLEAAGRATARMGTAHRHRGTPEEGIALVEPMIETLAGSGPSPALTSLHLALANLVFFTGRYREMLEAARRAGDLARAIGDERLLGEAEERRGVALIILGQPEEGRRAIDGALPLIEAGGDLPVLWRALNNVGEACKVSGDIGGARRYTEQSVEIAERIGNPDQTAFALANLGNILTIQGDWHGAREALERALALARSGGLSASVASALGYLGQLSLWEGDRERASHYLREALAVAEETHDRQAQEGVHALWAGLDVLEGRPDQAVVRLEPLVSREDANLGLLLPILARAQLESGDSTTAAETAVRCVERTREQALYLIDALRVQGMVLMRQGQNERAAVILTEGLTLARSAPYPYAEAHMLVELGTARPAGYPLGGSQAVADRAELEQALAIFRRLGAKKDIERTKQALAHLQVQG